MTTTPMTDPPAVSAATADPLAPLRDALLAQARSDAEATLAQAEGEAQAQLTQARAEAEQVVAQARAEGEHDAEQLRLEQRARARRRARSTVLAEQSRGLEALRHTVQSRLTELWTDPATHDAVVRRLTAAAQRDLGADISVAELPEAGIVAMAGKVRATYRLGDLADLAIDSLATELVGLWTP
jgi:vacuolar-type H+-ATPase subunit E/Vma4